MGQGPSTPQTNKTYINTFYSKSIPKTPKKKKTGFGVTKSFGIGNFLSALDDIKHSTVKDTTLLKYIRCNYYTASEYTEIDKNLLPKHMCKIRKTVNVGDTTIKGSTDSILKKLKFNTKKHGDDLDMYQFTLNKKQLRKLEETVNNILSSFSKSVIGGKIPGPIYVAYSKVLDYNGTYIERYCKKLLSKAKQNSDTYKFFNELLKQLKSNRNIIDKTIFKRYVWKGNVDLIILIPNMNNTNRIHTNMFDYYIHNTIVDNLVNNTYMNNIIPEDVSKYPKFFQKFAIKQQNFIHDSNNICELHGCTTLNGSGETLDNILPNYSSDPSTMRANAKQTKIFLPSKCLRPVDYVKNGYNPKGNDIRKNFNFNLNIDYTDIVFEMIFCLAIDCMFKTAEKKNGVANRWLNYINLLRKDPNLLQPDELCDDHIISHMNSYIFECIKGIPPPESDKEDQPSLAIKPIKIEKNHYSKWNDDIMKELAKRKKEFPGVQEYIYPFFQVNTDKLNIKTFNLPWGDRLLSDNDFISEGEAKSFIQSHNNRYKLFVNRVGQFGIKDGNRIKVLYNSFRYNNDTYTFTIQSDCKLAIKSENTVIYLIAITDKSDFKGPLSIIIDNNGNINIYDNGFNLIPLNKEFRIINNNFRSDIDTIKNKGLWYYITGNNGYNYDEYNKYGDDKYDKYKKCEWITSEVIRDTKNTKDTKNIEDSIDSIDSIDTIDTINTKDSIDTKNNINTIDTIDTINTKDTKEQILTYNEIVTESFTNQYDILSRFKQLHNIFLEK